VTPARAAGADVSDDRRFVNNPFARRLHPEPSRSPFARAALALVSIVGALIMAVAFLLPLVFAEQLLARGVGAHRWGMVGAGVIVTAVYLRVAYGAARQWWAGRKRS
jgi:hypothetical protein